MQNGITGCELETIRRAAAVVLTSNSSGICLKGLKKITRNIRLRMLGPLANTQTRHLTNTGKHR
jgi:hypothetical protein